MTALAHVHDAVPLPAAAVPAAPRPPSVELPFEPQRLQRAATWAASATACAGGAFAALALVTGVFGLPPAAAAGFVLLAASIWLLLYRKHEQVLRALALAVMSVGAFGVAVGQLATTSALMLFLLGAAVALRDVRSERARTGAEAAAVAAGLIALFASVGHAFGVEHTGRLGAQVTVPVPTAALGLLLCIAVLLARPNRGIAGVVMSSSSGGFMARRLIPIILVVPIVVGTVTVLGVRLGLYDAAFGASVDVVIAIGIMVAALLVATHTLNRIDDERQRAADKILELNQHLLFRTGELEDSNRELEAFSYSVSHDLRAPIRHIGSFSDLLERRCAGRLDIQAQHYVKTIADAARRAGQLVDELLEFSRMGRTELRELEVDMNASVERTWRQLAHERAERRVELELSPLPEAWADPQMLHLVWQNLLGNALKYSRTREKAIVTVSARTEGGEVIYTVRDNGVGFDMQYADKLFGVFQRLHPQHEFEGSGIGLANVKRIVARHGGRVWAEGAVNRGASFSFSLPQRSTR